MLASLNEDFRDAIEKIRARALTFGDQRIYNNARAIMFSRRVCYMFVRPKKSFIELCFFLPREEDHPSIHSVHDVSKTKFSHTIRVSHSDQIEGDLIDWLGEAYDLAK